MRRQIRLASEFAFADCDIVFHRQLGFDLHCWPRNAKDCILQIEKLILDDTSKKPIAQHIQPGIGKAASIGRLGLHRLGDCVRNAKSRTNDARESPISSSQSA